MRAWPGRQEGVPGSRNHEQGPGVLAGTGLLGQGQWGAWEAGKNPLEVVVKPGCSVDQMQESRERGRRLASWVDNTPGA